MTSLLPTRLTTSPGVVLGRVEPRIVTKPLRDDLFTNPEASWGYDFSAFCTLIGYPLDEWQHRLAIRLGELFPDGSPRFRKAIVLIARQNGKSMLAILLVLYWMFIERVPLVFGTHKDRSDAKKAWKEAIELAESVPLLAEQLPQVYLVKQIGEEDFLNAYGSHYTFGAPNRRAGRGRTVHRALIDELREHKNWDCWDALVPATAAVGYPLILCLSNEGDEESVVLHKEYDAAENFILTGQGDPRTFLAAWSCPSGSDPLDLEALAYANPSLNRIRANGTGLREDVLLGEGAAAVAAGGEKLARHRIEYMCQRIDLLEAAIRPEDWNACGVHEDQAVDLAQHRRDVVVAFDVAMDGSHATLVAAATLDGITHVEVLAGWNGYGSRKKLRAELPGWLARVKPRKCTYFAGGPAAAVADEWSGKRLSNVRMEPIRAEDIVKACMGAEELIAAGHLRHTHAPLLDLHVRQAQQLPQGDGWRFARRGKAPIDAVYAMAGAIHAARTLPKLGPVVVG